MKKLLSAILTLAMTMSLLCVVPSSAETVSLSDEPTFYDDFSSYTSENSAIEALTSISGTYQELARGDGYTWKLSGTNVGAAGYDHPGKGQVTNGQLVITDDWKWGTGAVLDMGDIKLDTVKQIKFDSYGEASLKFLVGSDERMAHYEIGQNRSGSQGGYQPAGTTKSDLYFVKKLASDSAAENIDENSLSIYHVDENGDGVCDVPNSTVKNWTIKFIGNTISWECIAGDYTWTGSYTDAELPQIIENTKYIVEPLARGQSNPGYYDNIALWYETVVEIGEPAFYDDFSSYTGENSATEAVTSIKGTYQELARGDGYTWKLSGTNVGAASSDHPGKGQVTNGQLVITDDWKWGTGAVLDMGDIKLDTVKQIKFDSYGEASLKFLVGSDERAAHYEIGQNRSGSQGGYQPAGTTKSDLYFVKKLVSDSAAENIDENSLSIYHVDENSDGVCDVPNSTVKNWTIKFSGNTISWECIAGDYTWTGSYTDAELPQIIENTKYIVAPLARGQSNPGYYDNIALWYETVVEIGEPAFYDDFSSYTSENSATEAVTSIKDTYQDIARGDGYTWKLSGTNVGALSQGYPGKAYIADEQLLINDKWHWGTSVVLDMGEIELEELSKIKFTSYGDGAVFKFLLKENERMSHYEVGQVRDYSALYAPDGTAPGDLYFVKKLASDSEIENIDENSLSIYHVDTDGNGITDLPLGTAKNWTITFDENTISWECVAGAYTWSGSYTDEELPNMIEGTRYIVAPFARGDHPTYVDNVAIWGKFNVLAEADVYEDFVDYTSDNAVIGSDNALTSILGTEQLVAKKIDKRSNIDYQWKLSGVFGGAQPEGYPGGAYIDSGNLYVKDRWRWSTAVNFVEDEKTMASFAGINRLKFNASGSSPAMRFLISEDEKDYYEIGRVRNENDEVQLPALANQLYFKKYVDGSLTDYKTYDAPDYNYSSNVTYDIRISGTEISWTVIAGQYTWKDSYIDSDMKDIISATKYPVAATARTDGTAIFSDVSIYYTERKQPVESKDKETVTVNILPATYDISGDETLVAIIGYYDSEGKLVETVINEDVSSSENTSFEASKPAKDGSAKLFVWNAATYAPVTTAYVFYNFGIESYTITYPEYVTKAATFNINDCAASNDAVVALMKEYGIGATIGLTGSSEDYSMYEGDGIETANHTTHIEMYLTRGYVDAEGNTVSQPTYDECVESIETAETAIANGTGASPAGLVWPYFAPRERSFYSDLKAYAMANGYSYIRDNRVTGSFDIPADWYDWGFTGWVQAGNEASLADKAEEFQYLETSEMKLISIGGDGADMSDEELISCYESLFTALSGDDIWKATNIEISRYVQACNELEITKNDIYNPSDVTVYMIVNGENWIAEPDSYAHSITEE